MTMRCVFLSVVLLAFLGCESEQIEPAPVVSTPLELDPTEQIELTGWWSNGEQMLRLQQDGSYWRYASANRYHAAAEHGKWWQHSYAALWLAPYQQLVRPPTRVAITKIDGRLALRLNDLEPLLALEARPAAPEDKLVGWWEGTFGELRLGHDGRYAYSPPAPGDQPASVAGHLGSWRLGDEVVWLQPDAPNLERIRLRTVGRGDRLRLRADEGELQRRKPADADG